jgi:hypothetical protein|tara:strand:+ start:3162 stop:3761 length:600 start_codon:yes stop_codon:yes gene_type:complete
MARFNVNVEAPPAPNVKDIPPSTSFRVSIENPIAAKVKLKARKTLDGNILILDHPEIDIVLSPKNNKVLALSKNQYADHVYATQSRLFEHLVKNGVVDPASVHGGNVYGSLEALMLESAEPAKSDSLQTTLYSVVSFLLEEKPYYMATKRYELEVEKDLLEPNEEDSTELGEVPHEPRKGSLSQFKNMGSYGMFGTTGY